jgi:hypothetical protein
VKVSPPASKLSKTFFLSTVDSSIGDAEELTLFLLIEGACGRVNPAPDQTTGAVIVLLVVTATLAWRFLKLEGADFFPGAKRTGGFLWIPAAV